MNRRLQDLYPVQARYYRAMVFYRRVQWAMVLWSASIIPTSVGLAPKLLPWPWGLAPLLILAVLGLWVVGWGMPWVERRWQRCRRVYRVMNWKSSGLKFSHLRAWKDWPDENTLPPTVKGTQTVTRDYK